MEAAFIFDQVTEALWRHSFTIEMCECIECARVHTCTACAVRDLLFISIHSFLTLLLLISSFLVVFYPNLNMEHARASSTCAQTPTISFPTNENIKEVKLCSPTIPRSPSHHPFWSYSVYLHIYARIFRVSKRNIKSTAKLSCSIYLADFSSQRHNTIQCKCQRATFPFEVFHVSLIK